MLGFKDALGLQALPGQRVVLHLKDKPPDNQFVLARAFDAGALLYNPELKRISYHPWSQLEYLEIPRRPWHFTLIPH
jgi:hypothetical protein